MKAWHVHDGYPEEGSLLIYAETRNKARHMFITDHPLIGDFEYRLTIAKRVPEWDDLFDKPTTICSDSELPKGSPQFWEDEDVYV